MTIQFRRGTDAEATANNPTLALGEPGYTEEGTFKIGDGSTAWNDLDAIPIGASDARRKAVLGETNLVLWDNFERANGALGTAPSGQVWAGSSWVISGNQAVSSATVPTVIPVGLGNGRAVLHVKSTPADAGLVFRYVDASNYLGVFTSYERLRLYKVVAGAQTILASAGASGFGPLEVSWTLDAISVRLGHHALSHVLSAGDYTTFGTANTSIGLGARTNGAHRVESIAAWSHPS